MPGTLAEPVAVDTSIWIDGLRDGASRAALEALVLEGRALLPAPAVTELLLGARPGRERAALGELFEVTRVVTPAEEDYRQAGEIGALLRRKGVTVGTVDLVIAALALRLEAPVWSLDSHFGEISRHVKLRLHAG